MEIYCILCCNYILQNLHYYFARQSYQLCDVLSLCCTPKYLY